MYHRFSFNGKIVINFNYLLSPVGTSNQFTGKMKHILSSNTVFKLLKRSMCSENAKKNDLNQMSRNLEKYLSDSPLKNYKDKNEWATTPYPEGTRAETGKNDSIKIDPETTSIIMFPGQGNQYVGMGKSLLVHSVVNDMFDAASSILGYDLKKLCLNGPLQKLNKTEYCQPAILVCSLAAIEELKLMYPSAIASCIATCGFSLGEITALVFAGCINFETAVKITRVRARAMQECSEKVPSGMMTILYGADSTLTDAMRDAKNECISQGISDPVCEVANYLFPECKVIAGHKVALNYIENNQSKYKLRKLSRLPVSGAFHTVLMKEAAETFQKTLQKLKINEPLVPVLSNISGKPYNDPANIYKKLSKQICMPVKWEQTLHYLYSRTPGTGFPHTYECGPGKSLSVILRRVNFLAYHNCHHVQA